MIFVLAVIIMECNVALIEEKKLTSFVKTFLKRSNIVFIIAIMIIAIMSNKKLHWNKLLVVFLK